MILRSATEAAVQHDMPAFEGDVQSGFVQTRPTARVDRARVELRWQQVDDAVYACVLQHWTQYGQRGVAFSYLPPSATQDEAKFTYDGPLRVQRNGPRSISISVTVVRALAYD